MGQLLFFFCIGTFTEYPFVVNVENDCVLLVDFSFVFKFINGY